MKYSNGVVAFAALGFFAAFGQTLDSTGNGLLKGTFHFRQLQASNLDQSTGDVIEAVAVSGTITFDGAGLSSARSPSAKAISFLGDIHDARAEIVKDQSLCR